MEDRLHHASRPGRRHPRSRQCDPPGPCACRIPTVPRQLIFLGPTGVGKNRTGSRLAEFLFDDEQSMVRIDMFEYQEKHTVSRLRRTPGYIDTRRQASDRAVRRRPTQ